MPAPLAFAVALAGVGLLAAAVAAPAPAGGASVDGPVPAGAARFLLFGDFGTGDAGQFRVAAAMERVCAERGCDFAVTTGDNIYESGVDGPDDAQFETKFEVPYRTLAIPFYLVLGNHDNGDTFTDSGSGADSRRGDHQVAYAQRDDRLTDRWHMPARYYSVRVGDLEFFGLDTNTMVWMGDPLVQRDPLALAQSAWFREAVAASDARWKFTFGHHPYVSNGQHGDAGRYDGVPGHGLLVERFYEAEACGRVDFVLAGHDHDLQWLAPVAGCGATEFIVSGAGAKTRPLEDPDRHAARFQRGDTRGFFWVEIAGDAFTGTAYDEDAAVLFERAFVKGP